jgi:hypothetical protein
MTVFYARWRGEKTTCVAKLQQFLAKAPQRRFASLKKNEQFHVFTKLLFFSI